MNQRAHILMLAVFALAGSPLAGCSAASAGSMDGLEESPPDGTSQASDEVVSSVDCTPTKDTAYANGQPYAIDVIRVGGKKISMPTGHALLKMQAAAHSAGVSLTLTSGFRTNSEQAYFYNCYVTCSCNSCNPADPPGYSKHQSGIAVDLNTSDWGWLQSHAGSFGFYNNVPSEPWHYIYTRSADPGGPCAQEALGSRLDWVSPKAGGSYLNGIWFKTTNDDGKVKRVEYWAGNYGLGDSTDRAGGFAVRYTFSQTGVRSITALGFDAGNKKVAQSTITIEVVPNS